MFPIVYEFLLGILAVASIPKIAKGWYKHGKYKESLPRRFGKDFPKIEKGNRKCIWIHAVSVGETKAIAPLAQMLKKDDPNCLLIISSVTETAHAEAKKSLPFADYQVYLPFDFRWVVKPIIDKVAPNMVLLCETDFWYNFLACAKKQGACIYLVNGKLSERSQQRFQRYPWFAVRMFDLIDKLYVQCVPYAKRFLSLGVPADKIVVTGNIKLDYPIKGMPQEELTALQRKLGIEKGEPLLVVGSTHDPEEAQILDVLKKVWKKHPQLKVMIVPRHPERFKAVSEIVEKQNLPYVRYTQLEGRSEVPKVILMDAMGVLRNAYQCCTVAIVAGSYTEKVGGHNILEPSWYGKPVIYGPHMWSQPDLVELMKDYKAGLQVRIEDLEGILNTLLENPHKREELGKAGIKLVEEARGATERTNQLIASDFNLRTNRESVKV